jgi:hypothetical protein
MAREGTYEDDHARYHRAQDAAYNTEHFGAYLLALAAIVLGVLGMLTAFQIVELRDYGTGAGGFEIPTAGDNQQGEGQTDTGADVGGGQGEADVGGVGIEAQSVTSESFWDGMLLLTVGLAAGMLALCLHMSDHHRMRDPRSLSDEDTGLWSAEHIGAYLFALTTIALGTIALLTGFNAFGADTNQLDGMIWAFAAFGSSILTTTLHAVRHHQTISEEDHLVQVVRDRVGTGEFGTSRGGTTYREPTRERTR